MDQNKVSYTALLTAYARAYHATHDSPKIFDDFLANEVFTEDERAFFGKGLAESLKFFDPERAAASLTRRPPWRGICSSKAGR
jgi:O-methyltransferase involved in polyketide biosynthesis